MEALRSDVLLSLAKVECLRIVRDPKTLVFLVAVFSLPFAAGLAGGSAATVQMMTALFLPVVIGWSWGRDIGSGRLVQLAVSHYSRVSLLLVRVAVFATLFTAAALAATSVSDAPAEEKIVAVLFMSHVMLLGFLLCTIFRSAEVGWMPLFAAFAGVWLPMLFVMKQGSTGIPQQWLRWLTAAFLPPFALGLKFYSARQLMVVYAVLAVLWGALAVISVRLPETLEQSSDE